MSLKEGGSCLSEWDDGEERRAHTKHHQTTTDGVKRSREKNPLHQADHKSEIASLW